MLALALVAQAALIVMRFGRAAHPEAPRVVRAALAPPPRIIISTIVRNHLFGVAPVAAANVTTTPSSARLVLSGTLAMEAPEKGFAIIARNGLAQKVYMVGDSISSGARLKSVYKDHVLIEQGGSTEELQLLREILGGGAAATLPAPTANATAPSSLGEQPLLSAPLIHPLPVFTNGKQSGYRVYPTGGLQAFTSLGLRPGDIVTAANGTPLNNPASGELLRKLGNAGVFSLTVLRDGKEEELAVGPSASGP